MDDRSCSTTYVTIRFVTAAIRVWGGWGHAKPCSRPVPGGALVRSWPSRKRLREGVKKSSGGRDGPGWPPPSPIIGRAGIGSPLSKHKWRNRLLGGLFHR